MCTGLRDFSYGYKCVSGWGVGIYVCAAAIVGAGAEEERSGEKTEDGRRAVDVQCSHP